MRFLNTEQFRAMPAADLVAQYPVLVAASQFVASGHDLARMARYAEMGGTLVVGPRTGYGDLEARARLAVAPVPAARGRGAHL